MKAHENCYGGYLAPFSIDLSHHTRDYHGSGDINAIFNKQPADSEFNIANQYSKQR